MADQEQQKQRNLRPAQVTASTLAATTGAFLASRLGVYGTVIGVGVMSLISTIGTELYIQSLNRTRQAARFASRTKARIAGSEGVAARAVATGDEGRDGQDDTVASDGKPADTAEQDAVTADRQPAAGEEPGEDAPTAEGVPSIEDVSGTENASGVDDETGAEQEPGAGEPASAEAQDAPRRSPGRLRWSLVAAGTAVAFVLAMFIVTGIEAISGTTLSGTEGSTVGKIVTGDTASDEQPPAPEEDEPDDGGPAPTDEPTEPEPETETEPTEPAPTTGDEEAEDEGGTSTTEPTEEDGTAPPEEEEQPPPTEEEEGDQNDTPEDEEPAPEE